MHAVVFARLRLFHRIWRQIWRPKRPPG